MLFDRNAIKMLQRMGMNAEELQGKEARILLEDEEIIIENPKIIVIQMQGQKVYQILGKERVVEKINDEDVKIIMEKTGASREEAEKAIKESNGDLAEAIMKISQKRQSG